jgi:hypothetical protein
LRASARQIATPTARLRDGRSRGGSANVHPRDRARPDPNDRDVPATRGRGPAVEDARIGRIHLVKDLQRGEARVARRTEFGADPRLVEQFHGRREAIAAPRQGLDRDALPAQAFDPFPHGGAAHAETPRQRFAGLHGAVGERHQQRGVD